MWLYSCGSLAAEKRGHTHGLCRRSFLFLFFFFVFRFLCSFVRGGVCRWSDFLTDENLFSFRRKRPPPFLGGPPFSPRSPLFLASSFCVVVVAKQKQDDPEKIEHISWGSSPVRFIDAHLGVYFVCALPTDFCARVIDGLLLVHRCRCVS